MGCGEWVLGRSELGRTRLEKKRGREGGKEGKQQEKTYRPCLARE